MRPAIAALGILLVLIILWDGFETVILPRRVRRRVRLTALFYWTSWRVWSAPVRRRTRRKRAEDYLSAFGPLAVLVLPVIWAVGLVVGFAMIYWAAGITGFGSAVYFSGTTFITLGIGDITPANAPARAVTVLESGCGFGFLAVVISYLPVLYQAFSRREVNISLLDARAGTPPSAGELIRRLGQAGGLGQLDGLLRDWERWSAELLESHISYPSLIYFRSQHNNQSWLGALTAVLDTCALIISGVEGAPRWQAELTFAMARHAAVDLAQIMNTPPRPPVPDRLSKNACGELVKTLEGAGVMMRSETPGRLVELRRMYEPYVDSLAAHLLLSLPAWLHDPDSVDNWRTSAWERRSTGLPRTLFPQTGDEEHR